MKKLEKQVGKIQKETIKGYEILKDEIEYKKDDVINNFKKDCNDIKENVGDFVNENYLEMRKRLNKMFELNKKKDR